MPIDLQKFKPIASKLPALSTFAGAKKTDGVKPTNVVEQIFGLYIMYIIVVFPQLNFPIFEAVSLVMIDVCLGYG